MGQNERRSHRYLRTVVSSSTSKQYSAFERTRDIFISLVSTTLTGIARHCTTRPETKSDFIMHGIKLFTVAAFASSNGIVNNNNDKFHNRAVILTMQRPVVVNDINVVDVDVNADAYDTVIFGRRKALQTILMGATAAAAVSQPSASWALDMDAFANAQIDADKKNCNPKIDPKCAPKMTEAEALCKYGQSGNARADACKKFKQEGGTLPSATKEKSLGGAYAI